jgi:phenylacetate-CoA ligase
MRGANALTMNLRNLIRPLYHRLPVQIRAPRVYWETRRFLRKSNSWDLQQIAEYQTRQLRTVLRHCAQNVPYYRALFRKVGFDPLQVRQPSDLRNLPTLDIETIRSRTNEFLATNIDRREWVYFTTGGTLGRPLGLYNLRDSGWRERAFIETLWSRIGFHLNSTRAILRGTAVTNKRGWFYDPKERAYVFSNFRLTPCTARQYAEIMHRKQPSFFHCYPSSMVDFARCLKENDSQPPSFQALLAGSENLYPGQQEMAESFFGCRMFTWMGHSENTVLAGGCELGNLYHIFPEYGYVEILSEDGNKLDAEGTTGELVGTSFYNLVMPLIRYRTGDWATTGPRSCSCGRNHRLLRHVQGRRDQEALIGRFGNRMSITAINMHTSLFDHVRQFQFYQRDRGKAQLKIVRGPGYTERDTATITKELGEKMGETLDLTVHFVDEIPVTGRGKFRFIVQECAGPSREN